MSKKLDEAIEKLKDIGERSQLLSDRIDADLQAFRERISKYTKR